jgi:hypothetical protein
MSRRTFHQIGLVLAALSINGTTALCNDTAAELSIGGLQFTRTNDIVMDGEDLRISADRVAVNYRFINVSGKPVTLTVAFPLPDIDLSEPDNIALPSNDPVNFVDFETRIDGRPAKFRIDQRAMVGGKDFSDLLSQFKLPLLPIGNREIRTSDLPAATRERLLAEGLLVPAGTGDNGRPFYSFGWIVKTSAVRSQTFPFDHPVSVEHLYKPIVGNSTDTILRKPLRLSKGLAAEVERYRKEYCVSDSFLAGIDKLLDDGSHKPVQERRIGYVLKTGGNWSGPIKNFTLAIDPGGRNRLVSFCLGALKPSPTQATEFFAKDLKPDADLKILIVGRF